MIQPGDVPAARRLRGRERTVVPEVTPLQETVEAQAQQITELTDEATALREQVEALTTRLEDLEAVTLSTNPEGV